MKEIADRLIHEVVKISDNQEELTQNIITILNRLSQTIRDTDAPEESKLETADHILVLIISALAKEIKG